MCRSSGLGTKMRNQSGKMQPVKVHYPSSQPRVGSEGDFNSRMGAARCLFFGCMVVLNTEAASWLRMWHLFPFFLDYWWRQFKPTCPKSHAWYPGHFLVREKYPLWPGRKSSRLAQLFLGYGGMERGFCEAEEEESFCKHWWTSPALARSDPSLQLGVCAGASGMAVPLFPVQGHEVAKGLAWMGSCGHWNSSGDLEAQGFPRLLPSIYSSKGSLVTEIQFQPRVWKGGEALLLCVDLSRVI